MKLLFFRVGQACLVLIGGFIFARFAPQVGMKAGELASRLGTQWVQVVRLLIPNFVSATYIAILQWDPIERIMWFPRHIPGWKSKK